LLHIMYLLLYILYISYYILQKFQSKNPSYAIQH